MSENTKNSDVERFVQDLEERGIIADITSREDLIKALENGKKIYFGIDPTADFLHLGHYLPLTIVKRFLMQGHDVVIVLGDLTAQIGDPSFRSKSRTYSFDVFKNTNSLSLEIEGILWGFDRKGNLQIFKNTDFLSNYLDEQRISGNINSIIWFLKNLCSQIKVNDLIHKDFIKDRLKNGLTLSEFCYPILQAWDFWYLYEHYDVCIQMGGKDQWTNILAGNDLINKNVKNQDDSKKPVGFTFPILSDSSGKKFGKSDGNAIKIFFKDFSFKSLAFQLFQYLINLDDALVLDYAKMLTFKEVSVINQWYKQGSQSLKRNFAYEVCKDIYGSNIADYCENISCKLFSGDVFDFSEDDFMSITASIPHCKFKMDEEVSLLRAFMGCNLVSSAGEFKRLWKQKGIKVFIKGNKLIDSIDYKLGVDDSITEFKYPDNSSLNFLILKRGQKSFGIVIFIGEPVPLAIGP